MTLISQKLSYTRTGCYSSTVWPIRLPFFWDTTRDTNGNHTLVATAYDTSSNRSSTTVTVQVSNGTAVTPSNVRLISSHHGTILSGIRVNLAAVVVDKVRVACVQFQLNGANLGNEINISPYTRSL